MKKYIIAFQFLMLIFLITGCIIIPRKQTLYNYNLTNLYYIDSLIQNIIFQKNNDILIVERYDNPRNYNFYYIIKDSSKFKIIRLCNRGLYYHKVTYLKSYYYLLENIDDVLTDTILNLKNRISDDPYISISGEFSQKNFSYEVSYRQIINGSFLGEYVFLFEKDILNLLEENRVSITQYPINNQKQLKKNINMFMDQCLHDPFDIMIQKKSDSKYKQKQ